MNYEEEDSISLEWPTQAANQLDGLQSNTRNNTLKHRPAL